MIDYYINSLSNVLNEGSSWLYLSQIIAICFILAWAWVKFPLNKKLLKLKIQKKLLHEEIDDLENFISIFSINKKVETNKKIFLQKTKIDKPKLISIKKEKNLIKTKSVIPIYQKAKSEIIKIAQNLQNISIKTKSVIPIYQKAKSEIIKIAQNLQNTSNKTYKAVCRKILNQKYSELPSLAFSDQSSMPNLSTKKNKKIKKNNTPKIKRKSPQEEGKKSNKPVTIIKNQKSAAIKKTKIDKKLGQIYTSPPNKIDKLSKVFDISPAEETRIYSLGIYQYKQIAQMTSQNFENLKNQAKLNKNKNWYFWSWAAQLKINNEKIEL